MVKPNPEKLVSTPIMLAIVVAAARGGRAGVCRCRRIAASGGCPRAPRATSIRPSRIIISDG